MMAATRRELLGLALAVPTLAALPAALRADTPRVYSNRGVAVDGSDVVAYFTEGAPVKGSAEIAYDWNGVTWHFMSEANLEAFAAKPARYAPQYGGYCAYAVSEGYTASTTPEAWKIVDDKLYLNYSRGVQRRWERDIAGRIAAADMNWPSVLK